MKQTAVEWLVNRLKKDKFITEFEIDLAKEMEKQQKGYSEEDMLRFAQKYAVNTLDKSHIKEFKNKQR